MTTAAEGRTVRDLRWERHLPLAGVLAVIGWVVGLILAASAADEEEGAEILAAYADHETRILAGGVIWLIATALFTWFLGSLRARLAAAEGPIAPLTAIAFGAGVAMTPLVALLPAADMAGALSHEELDVSAAVAIHNLSEAFFFGAEYLCAAFLAATALAVLRTRALPRWLGFAALAIALVLLIAPIGWVAMIFAFPLWVLATSFLLWREPRATTVAAGA